eukprot:10771593-Alexandrium_andersonii.AAC.1
MRARISVPASNTHVADAVDAAAAAAHLLPLPLCCSCSFCSCCNCDWCMARCACACVCVCALPSAHSVVVERPVAGYVDGRMYAGAACRWTVHARASDTCSHVQVPCNAPSHVLACSDSPRPQ